MFTREKFLLLSQEARHKKCYELLKKAILSPSMDEQKALFQHYSILCAYLGLPSIPFSSLELIEERFHYHISQTSRPLRESDFLFSISSQDKEKAEEWLGAWTYLDSLRSAHNVGSIIRTVEAYRLGPVRFSPSMLINPDHPQVKKTSMHAYHHVDIQRTTSFEELPRPWIALETAPNAPQVKDFSFPFPCTIIVGNEERGISEHMLKQADFILQIPLRGIKNSLNVSCAFAILASNVLAH
jgi:tRNA G18 (ribose-2'-O)-methylase SpoU